MLKQALGVKKVVLVAGYTDMRYGMDGLAALVRGIYGMDPFEEGTLYLFCGRKRDRIKGLIWDFDGPSLIQKRLFSGVYQWPRKPEEAMILNHEEFRRLMDGFTVTSSIRVPPKKVP